VLVFYDTETNGLWKDALPLEHPAQPKLVQLSAILVSYAGVVLSQLDAVVKPDGWSIPTAASDVHGITQAIAEEKGEALVDVLRKFNELTKAAQRRVGHNEAFDDKIIRHAWKVCKRVGQLPEQRSCTMIMARDVVKLPSNRPGGEYKWPNLGATYKFLFDRDLEGAHNSLVDVKACLAIYQELKKRGVADMDPVKDVGQKKSMRAGDWGDAMPGRSFKDLTELLKLAEEKESELSDWERGFISDVQSRVDEWGEKVLVSDKQWVILERVRVRFS